MILIFWKDTGYFRAILVIVIYRVILGLMRKENDLECVDIGMKMSGDYLIVLRNAQLTL